MSPNHNSSSITVSCTLAMMMSQLTANIHTHIYIFILISAFSISQLNKQCLSFSCCSEAHWVYQTSKIQGTTFHSSENKRLQKSIEERKIKTKQTNKKTSLHIRLPVWVSEEILFELGSWVLSTSQRSSKSHCWSQRLLIISGWNRSVRTGQI